MDARGAARPTRSASAARCACRATTREAAYVDHAAPAARPRSRARTRSAHILWLQDERPDIARATWKYLEPKDWLNYQADRPRASRRTTRSSCTGSPTTATAPTSTTTPSFFASRARPRDQLPDLGRRDRRRRPADGRRRGRARRSGRHPGRRRDARSADRPRSVRARSRDFEGHLYVGTSSWLTCHVPFKKTDLFHGIASLPSPLPGKYYVADEQEVAGGCARLVARTGAGDRR